MENKLKQGDYVVCLPSKRDGQIVAMKGNLAWVTWDDIGDSLVPISSLTARPPFRVGDKVTTAMEIGEVIGVHTKGIWVDWPHGRLNTFTHTEAIDRLERLPSENQMTG